MKSRRRRPYIVLLGLLGSASAAAAGPDCARLAAPTGAYEIERTTTLDRDGNRKVTTYIQRTERHADGSFDLTYTIDNRTTRHRYATDFHAVAVESDAARMLSSYDPMPEGPIFETGRILTTTRYLLRASGKGAASDQEVRIGARKSVAISGCTFDAYEVTIETRGRSNTIKPPVTRTTGDYVPALRIALTARTVGYADAAGTIEDVVSVVTSGEIRLP